MKVPTLIKAARKEAGLTQAELAKKMGVSQFHISRWESGVRMPNAEALLKIAKALGKQVAFIDNKGNASI